MKRRVAALRLVGVGWYIGTCIVLGVLGGLWFDDKFNTTPIMVIVGLVVLITVLMNTFERRHEYGLLLALGTSPGFIFRSIIVEMTMLSGLSVIVGLFFSSGLNWYFSINGIAIEPPMEYGGVVFSAISSEVSLFVMFVPAIFTIGVAFLVAFFPAIKSARAVPIEAMREN